MWEDQILWRDVGRTMRVAFSSVTSEVEKLATREVMGWGQGWRAATLSSSLCHAQSPSMCSCARAPAGLALSGSWEGWVG